MEKAAELLKQTDYKSYEISEKVGYGNPQYFSVLFKKHYGMSPSDYRKSQRDELSKKTNNL
ncbi:HTH-type transcriptional regulator YesS [compost metagenome]